MTAATASGAATKLTKPDPNDATASAMALSTYPYMVVKSVMMSGGEAIYSTFGYRVSAWRGYFLFDMFPKKSESFFPAST